LKKKFKIWPQINLLNTAVWGEGIILNQREFTGLFQYSQPQLKRVSKVTN